MFQRIAEKTFFLFAFVFVVQLALPISSSASTREVGDNGYVTAANWFTPEKSPDSGEGAYIKITFPKEGDVLPAGKNVVVQYEVNPGSKGDHFHYYLDGHQLASWRGRSGTLDYGVLPPGEHTITFKIATMAHTEIGVEKSVTFTVK